MKFNLFALVTILSCTTNAVVRASCMESTGVCVCSGECPSFTENWASTSSQGGENPSCVSLKDGGDHSTDPDGDITVNGKVYSLSTVDPCTSAIAGTGDNAAGLFGTYYYASVVVAAAAVAGGLAAL